MEIVKKLMVLQQQHAGDTTVQRNGTKLLGDPTRHYVYAPMPAEVQKELVESYRGEFPKELLAVYETANGFTLFFAARKIGRYSVPVACFDVYGVPTDANAVDALQPYHIRVEDLGRPDETPKSWLKFGSYRLPDADRTEWRLFVDTGNSRVYAVDADVKDCTIAAQWENIDACLCELFDRLQDL